ncbi:putative RNA-binding domain superfamily [Helianthus anomalus]
MGTQVWVGKYRELAGTYVAKKRDKGGRRFGFASFKNVKDKSELVRMLKGVKLGGCKLFVNIARFALENSDGGKPADYSILKPNNVGTGNSRTFNFRDSRSYSDVLGKGKTDEAGKEKTVVVPHRMVALSDLWGRAVVGRTVDLDRLLRIARVARGIWEPWFSKLAAREGQSLPSERVAWLRFLGVPLHLVDPKVLKAVGENFRKFLHVQKSLGDDKDLSVVRVGVLAGEAERIKESVSLKWKNRSYRIWVEDELDIWIPGCLGAEEGINPGMSSPLASSPVGKSSEIRYQGDVFVEYDEVCMGERKSRVVDPNRSVSNDGSTWGFPRKSVLTGSIFWILVQGLIPIFVGMGIRIFFISRLGESPRGLGRGGQ